jgi:hypothetical protein
VVPGLTFAIQAIFGVSALEAAVCCKVAAVTRAAVAGALLWVDITFFALEEGVVSEVTRLQALLAAAQRPNKSARHAVAAWLKD